MTTLFSILILASSISLIVSVLFQEGSEGLGAIGGNAPDSLWGKNRGTSKQAMLKRVTIVSAIIFIISALALAA